MKGFDVLIYLFKFLISWISLSIIQYSARTANTCIMQETTQVSTAVNPSA